MLSEEERNEIRKKLEKLKSEQERLESGKRKEIKEDRGGLQYAGTGFEFVITFGIFIAGGIFLDRKLDSSPWFLLAGAIVGFSAALVNLLRAVSKD